MTGGLAVHDPGSWRAWLVALGVLALVSPMAVEGQRPSQPDVLRGAEPFVYHAAFGTTIPAGFESREGAPETKGARAVEQAREVQGQPSSYWRHLLIGVAAGGAAGFVLGWCLDTGQGRANSSDDWWNFESDYYYRIWHTTIGAVLGGAVGSLIYGARD